MDSAGFISVIVKSGFANFVARPASRATCREPHAYERRPYPHQPSRQLAAAGRSAHCQCGPQIEQATDERAFEETLQKAIVDVVRKQKDIGIDVPGDGEFGKSMGHKVNYRAWWSYCFNRLGGLDLAGPGLHDAAPKRAKAGEVVLTSFADRRDRTKFLPVYQDPDGGVYTGPPMAQWPVCTGPVVYKGHDAIKADIAHFKAALQAAGVEEGFMTSVAPASGSRLAQRLLQERRRIHVRRRRGHA